MKIIIKDIFAIGVILIMVSTIKKPFKNKGQVK